MGEHANGTKITSTHPCALHLLVEGDFCTHSHAHHLPNPEKNEGILIVYILWVAPNDVHINNYRKVLTYSTLANVAIVSKKKNIVKGCKKSVKLLVTLKFSCWSPVNRICLLTRSCWHFSKMHRHHQLHLMFQGKGSSLKVPYLRSRQTMTQLEPDKTQHYKHYMMGFVSHFVI